jgi:hypothetical protein
MCLTEKFKPAHHAPQIINPSGYTTGGFDVANGKKLMAVRLGGYHFFASRDVLETCRVNLFGG